MQLLEFQLVTSIVAHTVMSPVFIPKEHSDHAAFCATPRVAQNSSED